jgi:putative mRNA 3-end processing factor
MKLIFHGGASQIGRSCIELITLEGRFLLDAGLWITKEGAEFPTEIKELNKIDAILISHAHLDHTGALPLLEHNGLKCNVYSTKGTKEISNLLLRDSFKISKLNHQHVVYNKCDINKIIDFFKEINFNEKINIKDITFSFYNSGHIPESACILIENKDKKLLYTGDINLNDTRLIKGANLNFEVDYLITEATYGNREHPSRKEQEDLLKNKVIETIKRNGIALIPAFAVGRAQEIMLILEDLKLNIPIYLDGMAKQVSKMFLEHNDLLKEPTKYKEILNKIEFVESNEQREILIKKPCIIITTSGMVSGGPVMFYLERLFNDNKNSIILTGYQSEETNGRNISEKNYFILDGVEKKINMNILHLDFSAHSGLKELKEMILKLKPRKVIVQHGDKEAIENLCLWIKEQGIIALSPNTNDEIEV